jgi:hypothetical protein
LPHDNRLEAAEWSPDGQRIVTASWDGCGRIWTIPQVRSPPGSTWLADIAEAFGGVQLRDDETSLRVSRDRLTELRSMIERQESSGEFLAWAQWLLADRATRPLAAGTTIVAREHALERFGDNKPDRVRQALRLSPMDPRGLARWSRLVLQQNEERNPRKLAEATWTAELATNIDPECFEAWCSLSQARLAAGNISGARDAFDRARNSPRATSSPEERRALADLRRRIDRAADAVPSSRP